MTLFGIGNNVTVWDVKISNPADSPNTDGIDPSAPEPRATSSRYDASHALTMTLDNVVPDPTTMDRTITRNWSPAVIGGDAPYNCVGKFVSLAGELSAQSGTAIAGQPVRITAVLQTVHNPAVQPTGSIKRGPTLRRT